MSANLADNEICNETRPVQPPAMPNPLASLVVPAVLAVLVICGVIFGVIPVLNMVYTAGKNVQKISEDGALSYSRN